MIWAPLCSAQIAKHGLAFGLFSHFRNPQVR